MKIIVKLMLCLAVGILTGCENIPTVGVKKPLLFDGHHTQSGSEEGFGEGDVTPASPVQKATEEAKNAKEAKAKTNIEYAKVLQARLRAKQRAEERAAILKKG